MASDTASITVRLPSKLKDDLESLSAATQRPKAHLVKEALENYLRDIQPYVSDLIAARKSADAGALHSKQQIFAWLDNWGKDGDAAPSAPDVSR